MSDVQLDPFTAVYNALWTLIERNQVLSRYIPIGNRISYREEQEPKNEITNADTPELAIVVGGGGFSNQNSSTNHSVYKEYILALTTGDLRLNSSLNPIQWELFRSITDWSCVLCALEWCDCRFVTRCQIVSEESGMVMHELSRSIPGWSSLLTIRVDMVFNTIKLKIN